MLPWAHYCECLAALSIPNLQDTPTVEEMRQTARDALLHGAKSGKLLEALSHFLECCAHLCAKSWLNAGSPPGYKSKSVKPKFPR